MSLRASCASGPRSHYNTLKLSLHCEVICSEGVPCRQKKKKNTLDLCHSQVPSVCLHPLNTVCCRYGQRWMAVHAVFFSTAQEPREERLSPQRPTRTSTDAAPLFFQSVLQISCERSVSLASQPSAKDRQELTDCVTRCRCSALNPPPIPAHHLA